MNHPLHSVAEQLTHIRRIAGNLPDMVNMETYAECGSPCCLWGECCVDPYYANQGFYLNGHNWYCTASREDFDSISLRTGIPQTLCKIMFDPTDEVDDDGVGVPIPKQWVIDRVDAAIEKWNSPLWASVE